MKTYAYIPKNLKEQFPQLMDLEDLTLLPMLDIAFNKWLEQIQEQDSVVTHIKKLPNPNYFYPYDSFYCVVDGKIISMDVSAVDIDVCDGDESWYMTNRVLFNGDDETGSKTLFDKFKNFIGEQGLEELISMSKTELQKGKTDHLSSKMRDFYLGPFENL